MQLLNSVALETVLNAIPAALVVIKGEGGEVIYVNNRAIQLLGVNPSGLKIQYFSEKLKLLKLTGETYPPGNLPSNKALLTGHEAKDDLVIERPDGSQVTISASAMPIRDKSGKVVAAVTIFVDITERMEMQQKFAEYTKNLEKIVEERTRKIKESEQSYHELYESFGEAFIATDWELNIIHWNKAAERVTTVKAKDALGKKIYDVLPEMTAVDVTPYLESLQQKKPTRFMMNTVSRETGQNATFEISTYPSTLGIIIIVEDKTEEEQTKRLSAIGQTASMVGHDIRNPLQAMTGDLFLLKEELKNLPPSGTIQVMEESIEAIDENIFYINKIVSDLQDYTRPLKPNMLKMNLKDLVTAILIGVNIPQNVETELNIQADLHLNTDPAYLKRALTNLISNAIQAMPNGGKLTIEAHIEEGKAIVNVADTGVGIPEEIKEHVFTPLFTTKSKGQGLGLAVVKRFVEGLNGKVTFQSQKGKGTRFTIELPAG